jgi:hypothetical protein
VLISQARGCGIHSASQCLFEETVFLLGLAPDTFSALLILCFVFGLHGGFVCLGFLLFGVMCMIDWVCWVVMVWLWIAGIWGVKCLGVVDVVVGGSGLYV